MSPGRAIDLLVGQSMRRTEPAATVEHARLELELTTLVVGWYRAAANGIKHSFGELLGPSQLRGGQI
jgi:hypothetical protein